jgi:hypothetical protein
MLQAMTACLDDLEALALIAGAVPAERLDAIIAHADRCSACRELIEGVCAGDEPVVTDAMIGVEVAGYRIGDLLAARAASVDSSARWRSPRGSYIPAWSRSTRPAAYPTVPRST